MKITKPGLYQTKDGRQVIIRSISENKAHGFIPKWYDRTWWYVTSGEHSICPSDDIVRYIEVDKTS